MLVLVATAGKGKRIQIYRNKIMIVGYINRPVEHLLLTQGNLQLFLPLKLLSKGNVSLYETNVFLPTNTINVSFEIKTMDRNTIVSRPTYQIDKHFYGLITTENLSVLSMMLNPNLYCIRKVKHGTNYQYVFYKY